MRQRHTGRGTSIILLICLYSNLTVCKKSVWKLHGKLYRLKMWREPSLIVPPHGFCQGSKMSSLKMLTYSRSTIVNISQDAFACLPSLETLSICNCGSFPLLGGLFSPLPTLNKLELNRKYHSSDCWNTNIFGKPCGPQNSMTYWDPYLPRK